MEPKSQSEQTFNLDDTSNTAKPNTRKGNSIKKISFTLFLVIILIAVFLGGFILGNRGRTASSNKLTQLSKLNNPDDPMYSNLQGSLNGQITQIEGNKAYVKSAKGGTGIFTIGSSVSVSEISGGKLIDLGNTQDKIRLNEDAIIKIAGVGNGYSIYAVSYLKDSPPNLQIPSNPLEQPKSASPAAKIKNE